MYLTYMRDVCDDMSFKIFGILPRYLKNNLSKDLDAIIGDEA